MGRLMLIVGHARSGTTVLQSALSTAHEVFLLGEANLYRTGNRARFRMWYNAMHEGYANQPCKITYAPALPGSTSSDDGNSYLERLSEHYEIFGEKLALGTPAGAHDYERLREWIEERRATCLFVFRSPLDTITSSTAMFPSLPVEWHAASYALVVKLFFDLASVLPNVYATTTESIDAISLARLGNQLGVNLSTAHEMYSESQIRTRSEEWPTPLASQANPLNALYHGIAALLDSNFSISQTKLQAAQKSHESPINNEVGALRNLAEQLIRSAQEQIPEAFLVPEPHD